MYICRFVHKYIRTCGSKTNKLFLFVYVAGEHFECTTMAEYLRNNTHLFSNLSYKKMRRFLVTYGVLTDDEQVRIDSIQNDEKYQIGLVFNYIINSLHGKKTSRLKSFLVLLEEDSDPDLKEAAKKLG